METPKVMRKYFDPKSGCGYVLVESPGLGRVYVKVRKEKRRILVGLDSDPSVPISKLRLLLSKYELPKEEEKKLRSLIELAVYELVNREARPGAVYKRSWFGAKIYIYEDHTVRVFDGGRELRTSIDNVEELKNVLVDVASRRGAKLEEITAELEKLFKDLPLYLTARPSPRTTSTKGLRYSGRPLNSFSSSAVISSS
ncbi:MAG: hypothetical protein DRJ52_10705, partial [Thermoprotei archaeon]